MERKYGHIINPIFPDIDVQ